MKALHARDNELFAGAYDQVAQFFSYTFHRPYPRKEHEESKFHSKFHSRHVTGGPPFSGGPPA